MLLFGENDLRITIDKNIIAKDIESNLIYRLLDENKYIIEVKGFNSIPLWLSNILSKNKMRECSFSKYGCAYLLREGKEIA